MEGPSVVLLEFRRLVTKILVLLLSNFGVVEARLKEPLVQPYWKYFLAEPSMQRTKLKYVSRPLLHLRGARFRKRLSVSTVAIFDIYVQMPPIWSSCPL